MTAIYVKNFNKQLKGFIREGTIRYNSLNWNEHLDEYTNNHNNHKNTTTKFTPSEIWREGNQEIIYFCKSQSIEKSHEEIRENPFKRN